MHEYNASFYRFRKLAAIVLGVSIVIGLGLYVFMFRDGPGGIRLGHKAVDDIVVHVGDRPYIAPCSIISLPQLKAASNGALTPEATYASETYYDATVPNQRNKTDAPLVSTCAYTRIFSGKPDLHPVSIQVYQPESAAAYPGAIAHQNLSEAQIDADIAALRRALGTHPDPTSQAFLAQLRAGKQAIENYIKNKGTPPYGAIVPYNLTQAAKSLSEKKYELTFLTLTKFGVIRIALSPDAQPKGLTSMTPSEITQRLSYASKLVALAQTNTDDAHISDQPLGGIIDKTSTPWGLHFLQPCSLLSDDVFSAAVGVLPNDRIIATSTSYDRDFSLQQKYQYGFESNLCEKRFRASNLSHDYAPTAAEKAFGPNGYADVLMVISYGATKGQVTSRIQDVGERRITLDTAADKAVIYNDTNLAFTVGLYEIEIDFTSAGSTQDDAISKQTAIDTINKIVSSMQ